MAESLDEVPIVMHSKYTAHVMMLEVISNKGNIMEPVFVPDSLRLITNDYVGLMDNYRYVKPWMDKMANGRL